MIFEKRGMWKISGRAQSYATLEEALARLGIQAEKATLASAVVAEAAAEVQKAALVERLEKLAQLAEDSTPFEKMIAKNICTICDMEPCECFTYIRKTDLGD
jgi:hypothetical protein